ncbi:MAG: OmpA family protein [Alcanivoracaceae bacterium]|nr:OmpA family protein [Alcanivoracaceae bacterium]
MYVPRRLFASLLFSLLCIASSAQAGSIADYHRLFGSVDEALAAARQAHADVLSPENFARAMKYYDEAKHDFQQRRDRDDVRENIDRASQWLLKALDTTDIAAVAFTATLQARDNARSAEAPRHARAIWDDAEEALRDATHEVEKGDIRDARERAGEVTALYQQAELSAIKTNYLSGARRLIEEADDIGADKYAIKTFIDAELLLKDAERELTQNRYDTDYPRDLARRARNEAQHAITLAKLAIGVKKKDFAVEDIVLNYERPLEDIADALDIVPSLHQGFEPTRDAILARVETLEKDSQALAQLRLVNAEQAAEIARLSEKLGIYNEQLAAEERYRELLAKLENIFTAEEAEIFRQGKNMIIRMVGLNFRSGKAKLETEHMKLLAKVKYAIELSNTELTTIEGHTDSFGGDDSNQTLSEQRANAVVTYLKEDPKLAGANMVAVGYGETRPIANNESEAGREKNRRTDVVIKLDRARAQTRGKPSMPTELESPAS